MSRSLYILGAGGFGRELYHWLQQHPESGRVWEVSGFLDDDPGALAGYDFPVGIVGGSQGFRPGKGDLVICALGNPRLKRRLIDDLKGRGAEFMGFVHPSVVMGEKVKLGEGVILCPGVILTSCLSLGDHVMVNCHSSAGHDVTVGSFSTISGHCDLTGFCGVGEEVLLGSGARLLPKVQVGDRAVVGAGAVVLRNVKADTTVFGNPAKVVWQET
ncbi:MAG: acetyltransferase [Opitutales bacterium]|nr:acetyltransferase [Opitutales bacterium]MCH8539995.1 acetyltransferase [Opitutales bacterium]